MKKLLYTALFLLYNLTFAQVGINTTNPDPSSIIDVTGTDKGMLVPRVGLSDVTTVSLDGTNTAATGLLIWNTNGTVTGGDGIGFYYFNGAIWEKIATGAVNSENGLSLTGTTLRLGGNLNQNTTINQGNFNLDFDLNGTGDFLITDGATPFFEILNDGNSTFWGNIIARDEGGTGQITARIVDAGDQGIMDVYNDGIVQHRLDAGAESVINSRGLNFDFRVESNNEPNLLIVDASDDVLRVGGNSTLGLLNNGATVNGAVTVEYVAAFYEGTTNGTSVQLGSTEYVTDIGNLLMSVYGGWVPYTDNNFDLGNSTFRWDDLYATSGVVNTSDITLKTNVKKLDYGLAEILKLQPISYQWKEARDPDEIKLGFSAQQLLEVLPEVVKTHDYVYEDENAAPVKKENDKLGVYYSDIIPVLTNAIQEQQQLIKTLEKRIQTLEQKN